VDIKAALAAAKLPECSVPLCLRGDLVAEFEALERKLQGLEQPAGGASLAGVPQRRELAEQLEALRQEMTDASVEFRLRALPRRRWSELMLKHPPLDGNDGDRAMGINEQSFFEAMVGECLVDPQLTADELSHLLDEVLTSAQYDQISMAAWRLNRRDVDVPFSRAASRILQSSESE
jgi:hypothetical protein